MISDVLFDVLEEIAGYRREMPDVDHSQHLDDLMKHMRHVLTLLDCPLAYESCIVHDHEVRFRCGE